MSTANYSNCIVTVIARGFRQFGVPRTPEETSDMAAWVRCTVEDIKAGRVTPSLRDDSASRRDDPSNDESWTRY